MTRRPRAKVSWLHSEPERPALLSSFELASLSAFGVVYCDNFIDRLKASKVRAQAGRMVGTGLMRPAGIGRGQNFQTDAKTRGDSIGWVDTGDCHAAFHPLLRQIERLRAELNRTAFLGLTHYEVQCSVHQAGSAGFRRHTDTFQDTGIQRRLTALFYLNPGWQFDHGGMLQLHLPSGRMDIEPLDNRFVVFLSDIEHEVTPVHKKRLAMTAWFYCGYRL